MTVRRPAVCVAVVMERVAQPNRWEDWQHRVVEVVADEADASIARPVAVSLSYIEADRWLSADGKVDNVPLQDDLREWLRVFPAVGLGYPLHHDGNADRGTPHCHVAQSSTNSPGTRLNSRRLCDTRTRLLALAWPAISTS